MSARVVASRPENPLGQATPPVTAYAPEVLYAVPRQGARDGLGLEAGAPLPFVGEDIWHAWELSWLDTNEVPRAGVARIAVPCHSPNLVESKSCKLYLNSLNFRVFQNTAVLCTTIAADLARVIGLAPTVQLLSVEAEELLPDTLPGICLDQCQPAAVAEMPRPELLRATPGAGGCWHSHLLRSLCPVTGQPDWASVVIRCRGSDLDPSSLLTYLLSYRQHREFHEQCVERIFLHLQQACAPDQLSVQALYTRRGGLDINPFRSTDQSRAPRLRSSRQ